MLEQKDQLELKKQEDTRFSMFHKIDTTVTTVLHCFNYYLTVFMLLHFNLLSFNTRGFIILSSPSPCTVLGKFNVF